MQLGHTPTIGNKTARQHALIHAESGSHALLIDGPRGIGKARFAGQLACWLLGGAQRTEDQLLPNPEHPVTRQIINGGHPDFLQVCAEDFAQKSRQIPAAALETIRHFTQRKGDSPRRIVLLDALDDCVPTLSHGLLKLLEEPPSGLLFLLIVHRVGRILDTIRSRAQRVVFHKLNQAAMHVCLDELNLDDTITAPETLITLCGGTPGQLCLLARIDLEKMLSVLGTQLATPTFNSSATHDLVRQICDKKTDNLAAWPCLARWLAHNALREQITGKATDCSESATNALAPFRTIYGGDKMCATFQETLNLLEKIQRPPAYLAPEQSIFNVLSRWHRLIHSRPQ